MTFAQDKIACGHWQAFGSMKTLMEKWDLLLATADKNKNFLKDINEFKNKYGLLMEASPLPHKMNGPPTDRLEGEGPGGTTYGLFFKKLSCGKSCDLDDVWEVGAWDGKKKLAHWSVPRDVPPMAIEGDELFFEYQLRGCTNESRGVVIALKKTGEYRVVEKKLPVLDENKKMVGPLCTAPKMVFPDSNFGVCSELEDMKSKKKRVMVWEAPVT